MKVVESLSSYEGKTVTVYASSSGGVSAEYKSAAFELGKLIAQEGWRQVNGGGRSGLMGAATDGGLDGRGEVDSVILDIFMGNHHEGLRDVVVCSNMSDRKKGLYDAADAVIVLPGGLGTLEEISEVLSWRQLNFHSKPITFLNVAGYFDPLLKFIEKASDLFFIADDFRCVFDSGETPEEAISLSKTSLNSTPHVINQTAVFAGKMNADWTTRNPGRPS